jgi:hypothetical protein
MKEGERGRKGEGEKGRKGEGKSNQRDGRVMLSLPLSLSPLLPFSPSE